MKKSNINNIGGIYAAFLALFALSGCNSNLDALRETELNMDNYSNVLAADYLSYSESESEQGRTEASEYFAGKGLRSVKGERVLPDEASGKQLKTARRDVLDLQTEDMKEVATDEVAITQVLFDCWNAEVKRVAGKADAVCGDAFAQALEEAQKISDSLTYGVGGKKVVVFDAGSADINENMRDSIQEFVKRVSKRRPVFKISVRKSPDNELTKARVQSVVYAMVKSGVKKSMIIIDKPVGSREVLLSNDEEMQGSDEVDICVASRHKFKRRK